MYPTAASAMSLNFKRIFTSCAVAALVVGLSPVVADAAPRKGTVAKKAVAAKRVVRSFAASAKRHSVVQVIVV